MIKNEDDIRFYSEKTKPAVDQYKFNKQMVFFYQFYNGGHTNESPISFLRDCFDSCYSSYIVNSTGDFFTIYVVQSNFLAN